MCGRFILQGTWSEIYEWFNLIPGTPARNLRARYNRLPTQDALFVTQGEGGRARKEGRWWLVPHWAKEIPKYTHLQCPVRGCRQETRLSRRIQMGPLPDPCERLF